MHLLSYNGCEMREHFKCGNMNGNLVAWFETCENEYRLKRSGYLSIKVKEQEEKKGKDEVYRFLISNFLFKACVFAHTYGLQVCFITIFSWEQF